MSQSRSMGTARYSRAEVNRVHRANPCDNQIQGRTQSTGMSLTTIEPYLRFEKCSTEALDAMGYAEFDALPFGAIRLDCRGRILAYNMTESLYSGFRYHHVIGRNFFEVAPCANTSKFFGKFKAGVVGGAIDVIFDYFFARLSEPNVLVHMIRAAPIEDFWLLIKRT